MAVRRGKIFDKVLYLNNGYNFEMPLRMENVGGMRTAPRYRYFIDIDHPIRVFVSGNTPEEVVKAATAQLDDALGVEWVKVMYVDVDSGRPTFCEKALGHRIEVTVEIYEIAKTKLGKWRHRIIYPHNPRRVSSDSDGLPGTCKREDLIDYTPELYEKLEAMVEQLAKLGEAITGLLHPSRVLTTLATSRAIVHDPKKLLAGEEES